MSVLLTLSIVQPMPEFLNAYPRVLILIKWDASCHSRPSSVTPSRFESSFYLVYSDLHFFFSFFFKTFITRLLSSNTKNYHKGEVCKIRTRTRTPQNTPKTPRKSPDRNGKQSRTHVRMQYRANKNLKQRGD